jgi:hypothetical protein
MTVKDHLLMAPFRGVAVQVGQAVVGLFDLYEKFHFPDGSTTGLIRYGLLAGFEKPNTSRV